MHSGPTFRPRLSISARFAFANGAIARVDDSRSLPGANRCSNHVGAKAKKQPLI
jgi:hypothetical protein